MTSDKKHPPLNELISLRGKKVLITGGASGIGFATASRLAEAGAAVTLVDTNMEKGTAAAQSLIEIGYTAFFVTCDISKEEEVKAALKGAVGRMNGLDILVNNAGIFPATPLLEITAGELNRVMSVNLNGLVFLSREAVRYWSEQKVSGNIINISSVDALHPIRKNMSIYDASKGAVSSITRSLAKELASENVRVNAIAPGGILTEGAISGPRTDNSRAGLRDTLSRIPLGHMGSADDIARVVLFLASDLSSYMTGSLITVDGGFMIS
jgi:2-dehydro-3-deoxy-D-gluconate 5-dehydrogenase